MVKGVPVKRKVSAQVIALRRLLSLCNEHTSAVGFTIDDIARLPSLKDRKIKRNSIIKAFDRFIKLNIVFSGGTNAKGQRLYRIKNNELANAYIEGDPKKPWLPLTPPVEVDEFPDVDNHRPHYPVQLTKEWFERLKRQAQVKSNEYTLRTKEFTLSVNGTSFKGTLYIKPYWRTGVQKFFGQDFLDYIMGLDSKGMKRGDFCLPVDVKGERFTIGGRPTQFSSSHYPAQLDIRASDKDSHIKEGLYALTNQADFNVRVLDMFDALLETLNKQGEVQRRNTEALEKLVKLLTPNAEPEYKNGDKKDDDGIMFG
jgi:hypothetical protein